MIGAAMIRTLLCQPATGEVTSGGEDLLDSWSRQPDAILWLDLAELEADAEQRLLAGRFGLHPLAISDAQRRRHQPKIERFADHLFVLLKGLGPDRDDFEFETIQIALFIGERFLVTRHSGPSPSIDALWEATRRDGAVFAGGPDALALQIGRAHV